MQLNRSTLCVGAIDTIIKDNLIYNFTNNEMRGFAVYPYYSTDSSNTTLDHNLIYSDSYSSPIRVLSSYYTIATAPLAGLGNIQLAPIFVDYANNNFALLSGSPGKNAASDGMDMGADILLVSVQAISSTDTTPPSAPSGVVVL